MYRWTMVAVLYLSVATTFAQGDAKANICVNGTASVEVTPDFAVFSVTLKTVSPKLDQAADEHTISIKNAMAAIDTVGIPVKEYSTSNMRLGEHTIYRNGERVPAGFFAVTDATIKCRDLTKYLPLWKSLAKLSGVSVEQVAFDHSKRRSYQDEARTKALTAAHEKAQSMARILNCGIGRPLSIEEMTGSSYGYGNLSNVAQQRALGDVETASGTGGKLVVVATVKVTFALTDLTNPPR